MKLKGCIENGLLHQRNYKARLLQYRLKNQPRENSLNILFFNFDCNIINFLSCYQGNKSTKLHTKTLKLQDYSTKNSLPVLKDV